jgi:hypothetical protein
MKLPVTFNLVDITVGRHLGLTRTGQPRLNRLRMLGRPVMALARAATLVVAFSATRAYSADMVILLPQESLQTSFPHLSALLRRLPAHAGPLKSTATPWMRPVKSPVFLN